MKKLSTLILGSLALSASAAAMPQGAPAMEVPVPAGYSGFRPSSLTATPRPRFGTDRLQVPRIAAGVPPMYAYLRDTNIEGLERGFYALDLEGGSTFLWQDPMSAWAWTVDTGWYRDGAFWGLMSVKLNGMFMGYALTEFDITDGDILSIDYIDLGEEGMQSVFLSSAYRVMDDKVYGYGLSEDGEKLAFSVAPADDFHNVRVIRTVELEEFCTSLTYDSMTDTMYGVNGSGDFVSIDPKGNQTKLYNISGRISGLNPKVATGMGWDPARRACIYDGYLTVGPSTALYALYPDGTAPVLLEQSRGGELYTVMFSAVPNAAPAAPARAEFLGCDFEGVSLSGSLSWKLPSVTIAGDAIGGDMGYTLYVDGAKDSEGRGAAGASVTVDVESVSNGAHVFSLVCNLDGEAGEPAVYRQWIGADAPLAPGNVKLTETLVSWDVPTGSVHDGYVDYSDLTYTVYLNGRRLGETSATSFGYALPEGEPFTSYTAEVQATFKGWSSENGVSNYIQYGDPLSIPVHFRPEEKELEMMTLINVDGHVYDDGTQDTWRFTTEMGFPSFASGYNGDDWLILPPMTFDNTEKAYRFEMEIGLVHDVDTSGTYEVWIGKEPTVEGMTRVVIPESHCYHMLGDILEEFFAVPEAGVYYIGIHTVTHQVSFHVSDIDVRLSDRAASVPVGVTNLMAMPGAEGALTATVSFTMPEVTAAGEPLPADKELTAIVSSYATEPGYDKERELVESKTLTGLPGSDRTLEIATAQNYNAIVVAISTPDGLTGKGEETMVYTGVVRPYIVNDLKASVSEDNMTMTLTWTPPTEGEEAGPIGDSFLYVIYDYISSTWEYLDDAGWDVCEYSFTVPDNYPLSYLRLGVMAYNAAGLSYHVSGVAAAVGRPVDVPWTNDLDNDVTYDNAVVISPTEQYSDVYWVPADPAELISPIFANEAGFAFIGYTYEMTDRKSRLSLPKVTTAGLNDVVLSFDYWGGRNRAPMRLMAQNPAMDEPVVIAELPADPAGWTTYTLKLPVEFQDQGWVALFVEADFPDDQYFAMFSGYSFTSASGVKGTSAKDGAIIGGRGMLTLSGLGGESLLVSDLQGRTVLRRDRLAAHEVLAIPAGIYVVRAGGATAKVVVR